MSKNKMLGTALGTARMWEDYYDLPFKGVGEYNVDGMSLTITKAHRVEPPKEKEKHIGAKPNHPSLEKYGYGQMFFGVFRSNEVSEPNSDSSV